MPLIRHPHLNAWYLHVRHLPSDSRFDTPVLGYTSLLQVRLIFRNPWSEVFCSVVMEGDIHTVLDALTLLATGWVVFQIRVVLNHTYQAEMDNIYSYYVVSPVH